jgi:hypothetical protein
MRIWLAIVATVVLALGVSAAEPTDTDRAAIRQVIEDQLRAFREDNGERAFSFASPSIQAMFKTPERFMEMVRGAYPAVYRPREVAFKELEAVEGELVQVVVMVGPDGVPVVALYKMEWQEPGKVWRINGCVLVPSQDKAT